MANIQDVLAQLRANKAKRQNFEGASRRLCGTTIRGPRNTKDKYWSEDLGKKVGFCPNCDLVQGEKNLQTDCRRCGARIDKSTINKYSDSTNHMIWARRDPWGNPAVRASCPYVGFGCLEVA